MSSANTQITDYYVECAAMAVSNGIFDPAFLCRLERKIRKVLLHHRDPDCPTLKMLRRLTGQTGDGRAIVKSPAVTHPLDFRIGTSDQDVLHYVFAEWEFNLARLRRWPEIQTFLAAQHRLGRRPLIIDAGANIGVTSAFFALMFPTALVIAIEPEESNFDLLKKNTEGLKVTCLKAGLASEVQAARLLDPGEGHWAFRTQKADAGDGLSCVTINSLYEEYCDADVFPFLVKINIEGAEEDVFKDNTDWVRTTGIIAIELHDWLLPKQGVSRPFLKCISELNRDFVYSGFNVYSIDNTLLAGT